jgi:uncharacterized protein YegL
MAQVRKGEIMDEERGILLPVYFVADESWSMEPYIAELNEGIASLQETLQREPLAASKVRLSITGFSGDVVARMELADFRELAFTPTLSTRTTGTSYQAAFGDLLTRIPNDKARLKQQGYKIHRPVVFFLTDGAPTDGAAWEDTRRRLTDPEVIKAHPNIIAFGIGDGADAATIRKIATEPHFAMLAVAGADMGKVISEFIKVFVQSVMQSGSALATGRSTLVVPMPDPNVLTIATDVVPDDD